MHIKNKQTTSRGSDLVGWWEALSGCLAVLAGCLAALAGCLAALSGCSAVLAGCLAVGGVIKNEGGGDEKELECQKSLWNIMAESSY